MSNLFDALEQARRERHEGDATASRSPVSGLVIEPEHVSDTSINADIVNMFVAIDEQLKGNANIIQLISTHHGEGVTYVAERFAKVAAELMNRRVLLLEVSEHAVDGDAARLLLEWQETLRSITERGNTLLPGSGSVVRGSVPLEICYKQLRQGSSVLSDLKSCFDLTLLDTPSAAIEPHSIELTRYSDVVVIVLEAERTRSFALESLQDKISQHSRALVGVVLNKRCFHIPTGLYSKLH